MNYKEVDIVICGAGLAGLSLAIRLASMEYAHLKILIIDKSRKDDNDRTWSFWSKARDDRFAAIYHKSWPKIAFYSDEIELISDCHPYAYHTIKGIDFYRHCLEIIEDVDHISFIQGEIEDIEESATGVTVRMSSGEIHAHYAYDSIVKKMPVEDKLFVWQHFLGWEIEMPEDTFDDEVATFMDFRIDQAGETRFVYVLPFSKRRALIEATIFSKELWEETSYEALIKDYISQHFGSTYKVLTKELGKIPMTTAAFAKASPRIIPIGTNAATVKPSSGYTFTRIQHEVDIISEQIKKGVHQVVAPKSKYIAYDKTLLNVLLTNKETASHVFSLMFKRNKVAANLKFLDEDTSLLDEIRIFSTLPFWPFLRAFTVENVLSFAKSKKIRQP